MAVSPEELETEHKVIQAQLVDDDSEPVDGAPIAELLREAGNLLKTNAHLLAYIGNPLLLRAISNRERKIIDKQLDSVTELIERLDAAADDLEDV